MKRHQWVGLVVSAVGALAGPVSHAEGFYFGISGGVSSLDLGSKSSADVAAMEAAEEAADEIGLNVGSFDSSLDDSGTVWGLQVGYQWNKYVGAELGYIHLGQGKYKANIGYTDDFDDPVVSEISTIRFRSNGPTLALVGFLPVSERFDLSAKGGVYFSDTRMRAKSVIPEIDDSIQFEEKDSAEDLFAGIGAAWNVSESYALRLEYQRFFDVGDDDTGEADVDVVTLSVLFR